MNLKKTGLARLILLAAAALAPPWAVHMFVPPSCGITAYMLLYWVIAPVCFAAAGAYAGKEPKKLWGLPVLAAVLTAAGMAMITTRADDLFLHGGIYLALGLGTMWFRAL